MVKYYKEKGYDAKSGQDLEIDVYDLPPKSHVEVKVLCDYGGEEYETKWYLYLRGRKVLEKDCCFNCRHKKEAESIQNTYGVSSVLELKDIKEKINNTLIEKYGTTKIMDIPGVKEQVKATNIERYGVENPNQSEEVKEKIRQTCLERYGDTNVLGSSSIKREEIYEKAIEAKQGIGNGGSVSKNQIYLANLYNGEINIKLGKYYLADIIFPEANIYCEYDGGGHDLQVKLGNITQEELDRKEEKRYYAIKAEGYKLFRIKNTTHHEILPKDNILLNIKDLAFKYLNKNGNNWIIFDIPNNKIITKNNEYNWDYLDYFTNEEIV